MRKTGEGEKAIVNRSKWEAWQRDYEFGLLLIMPPQEVAREIDVLRAQYDPRSFAICPAHISVSDPLRCAMTPVLRDEISRMLSAVEPFTLYFGKPHASTERAGVACPVSPQESIDHLKEVLHTAAVFAGQVYQRRDIPAHMTIAEFVSIAESLRICAELQSRVPGGSFLCDRLEFVVPDEKFSFQRVSSFRLGQWN